MGSETMEQKYSHRPVLLDECIEGLNIKPDGIYVDGTLGRAGHSAQIAQRLTTGRLYCIDRDIAAIGSARERLGPWMDRVELIHGNFTDLERLLTQAEVPPADGMLFDLGVSSPQLDDPARGFSYMHDAPLDMRMDQSQPLTARTVVNEWPQEELRRILYQYGEERYAPAIAGAIVRVRGQAPIETTLQLVEVIRRPRPCGRSSTPPSGPFRRSVSRSTMNSLRQNESFPRLFLCWRRAGGCVSLPSIPWRTGS